MRNTKAFSIVEIVVATIILGILAAIAIPNYLKSFSRTYAREARDNLMAIHSAQMIYKQANDSYYSDADTNQHVSEINNSLQLNVSPSGDTKYYCTPTECYAEFLGSGSFKMILNLTTPLKIEESVVYCNTAENPCCKPTGGQAGGSVCP